MTITALPTPPTSLDSANFATRSDEFLAALPALVTETNTVIDTVNAAAAAAATKSGEALASAVAANTSALSAATSASLAAASAGAPMWVSGTTYALGAAVWSPATKLIYRRSSAGSGVADPSVDAANWAVFGGGALMLVDAPSAAQTAAAGNHYALTNVSASTLTLPASPANGDTVAATVANSLTTNVIARNGQTIMGVAQDMTIDNSMATVTLRFINSSWRII